MSEQIGTVGMLLGLDPAEASDQRVDAADAVELGRKLCGALRDHLPPQHLPRASAETLAQLGGLLARPLVTCLTEAWNKRAEFKKFADPAQYPPDKVARMTLHPHTVTWTYRPSVEITLNGKAVAKLSFVVEVEFKLDGAELVAQGGKFMRLHTGKSTLTATLSYHGVVLKTRTLGEYALPGVVRFGEGIPIPGVAAPVSLAQPRPAAPRAPELSGEMR
jgi:hypothetical protein